MGKGRVPSITDYMAGALLANGPTWIWIIAMGYFSDIFSALPKVLIGGFSLIIYISGGSIASYLVCERADEGLLIVALKLVAAEWIFSIMMLSTLTEASSGQAFLLLICFTIGGFIGAYLSMRKRLRRL